MKKCYVSIRKKKTDSHYEDQLWFQSKSACKCHLHHPFHSSQYHHQYPFLHVQAPPAIWNYEGLQGKWYTWEAKPKVQLTRPNFIKSRMLTSNYDRQIKLVVELKISQQVRIFQSFVATQIHFICPYIKIIIIK